MDWVRTDTPTSRAARGEWFVLGLIVVFPLLWAVYATLSRYNLDRMGDMVENYAWGIAWQFGYYKHPPLYSWITAAWFTVFPRTNFFYHLLGSVSVAVALWTMWRISLRFFTLSQQRALVMAVFFLPPFTFLALNYNATSAMLPFWALTFLFYLRVLERRHFSDALLLGVMAGCAMLTKYHSVVLVMAIALHAIWDRDVRSLFRTALPWLAVAAGLAVLLPHVWWMVQQDFITVRYAADQGNGSWLTTSVYALRFLPVALLYTLPALGALALLRRFHDGYPLFQWSQLRAFWKSASGRALIFAALLPPVLTIVLGVALDAEVSSLWAIPFFVFLTFPLVALLPAGAAERGRVIVPVAIGVYALLLLIAAPFVRGYVVSEGKHNAAVPVAMIAHEAQRIWADSTGARLAIVAGQTNLYANGTSFYASDSPFAIQGNRLDLTPWVTPADIDRDGAAYICNVAGEARCQATASGLFGRIDEIVPFSVQGPETSQGTGEYKMLLFMRKPEQPS